MTGGVIKGNDAKKYGGGVLLFGSGNSLFSNIKFKKTGGTIYGSDAGDASNRVSGDTYGHAVAAVNTYETVERFIDTTLGPDDPLDW
jgi:hypothetical protein